MRVSSAMRAGCSATLMYSAAAAKSDVHNVAMSSRLWSMFRLSSGSVPEWVRMGSGSVPELFVADVDDLVALQAARGLDLDGVAGVLADERAGDGRADEDAALPDVGLVLADDLPGRGVAALFFDVHGGA